MRELTLTDMERLGAFDEADRTFQMTEDTFRSFYELTARPLRVYLSRMTSDDRLADDLLQETYYRFLRARAVYDSDAHRRNALFRIATNLARDGHRRGRAASLVPFPEGGRSPDELLSGVDVAADAQRRTDLARALARLKPRERAMLWLAYAQGSTHRDIAGTLGVKAASVRLLLFRARHKLAALLGANSSGRQGGGHDG
jgi:RNA polymerase sigma-70 factor (ECF subfamily)